MHRDISFFGSDVQPESKAGLGTFKALFGLSRPETCFQVKAESFPDKGHRIQLKDDPYSCHFGTFCQKVKSR